MSDFLLAQAVAAHRTNNLAEAERLYLATLADQPERADACYNLGLIYGQSGRPVEAFEVLQRAVALKPDFGEAWFMLCEFADKTGQQKVNVRAGEQAVRLLPNVPRAWLRYGLALSRVARDEEAVIAYRCAVQLDPSLVKGWINLAVSCKMIGRNEEAEAAIRKAIELSGQTLATDEEAEANYSFLHYHLALLELARGDYLPGFAHFRARFHGGTDWKRFESLRPLWRGEDLHGKTILVTAEQGHGDTLMMARYLPLLRARGACVVFQLHPALMRYFEGWAGTDRLLAIGDDAGSDFDCHVPIFDLPYRFGTTPCNMQTPGDYLPVPVADEKTDLSFIARKSREVFGRMGDSGPTVGVIWAGQAAHQNDKRRSLPLSVFADLFEVKDWQFFNLTRDMRPGEAEQLPHYPVINLASLMSDFADLARMIGQLDLIITCDTATAHLAGGMGMPVWVLLPFAPDWRWGLERRECPWYPSMRLFRQPRRGDWASVLTQVKEELPAFAAGLDIMPSRVRSG